MLQFRPPSCRGWGVRDYWISDTFREEVSIPFSGGYSTIQITGKTRYKNREDR